MIKSNRRTRVGRFLAGAAIGSLGLMISQSAAAQATTQSASIEAESAGAGSPERAAGASSQLDQSASNAPAEATAERDIVVTGTSIRGVAPVGSQLIQVDQRQIRATGRQTTADLLATIPQLNSFGSTPRPGSDGGSPTNPPSLHGLGPGATLSLLDNHRLVGLGTIGTTADPTSLPLAAVDRIEVLADGASATYGSDAVAGVINVILRKDLNGADVQSQYGYSNGYQQWTSSGALGKTWSTGSLMIAGQYSGNTTLFGRDRSFVRSNLSAFGGADSRSPYSPTPTVTVGGNNYIFNGSGFTPGTALYDEPANSSLIPESKKITAVASFRQDIGSSLHLFGDANFGDLKTHVLIPQTVASITIPNTNPFFRSPVIGATSETILYRFTREAGQYSRNDISSRYYGASFGVDADVTDNWKAQAYVNYGHSDTKVPQYNQTLVSTLTGLLDGAELATAAASSDPATAFDPFGNRTSAATLTRIFGTRNDPQSKQQLFQAVASVNGSLFSLPGGDVKVALGGEYRWEDYAGILYLAGTGQPETAVRGSTRNVKSGFAEIVVPIFGESNAIPGFQSLLLNASVRHDEYNDFGSTTNPKFGASWSPVRGIALRGSYSKSFHAPSLADLNAIDSRAQYLPGIYAPNFFTPLAQGQYNVLLLAGGNNDLQPEKARTYSFGLDVTPQFITGFRLSGSYFNIHYSNVVNIAAGAFTNAALTNNFVIFKPTQAQVDAAFAKVPAIWGAPLPTASLDLIVDLRRFNLGVQNIAGIDLNGSYTIDTASAGSFTVGADGIRYLTNESQAVPGSSFVNNLDQGVVKWLARGSVGWRLGSFNANAFVNYVGPYQNLGVTPVQTVKSITTVDTQIGYQFAPGIGGSKLTLTLDVRNLFDKDPPFLLNSPGYSATNTSPIGRIVQIGARVQF